MTFEWDPNKARINLVKHGISIRDAEEIFKGTYETTPGNVVDGEARQIALGELYGVLVLAVSTSIVTAKSESSPPARHHPKKSRFTMENETHPERLARLARAAKGPIDFSDIPELTDAQLASLKTVRGGFRPGAGRKRSNHIRLTLSVTPAFRRRLQTKADKEGVTLSAYVETHLTA